MLWNSNSDCRKNTEQTSRLCLALKKNQGNLYEDVSVYFSDEEEKETITKQGGYKRSIEKAHGQIEIREYYQTENIRWFGKKKDWKELKSIGMEEKTIQSEEGERKEYRYYISS